MLTYGLIGAGLVAATVAIHALGTSYWIGLLTRWARRRPAAHPTATTLRVLTSTVIVIVVLHTTQIFLWAAAYELLLPAGVLETFEEAVYFSFVTFTTVGFGDVVLTPGVRLLSGIEALNGIILVGWSTALLFAVVQRTMTTLGHAGVDE